MTVLVTALAVALPLNMAEGIGRIPVDRRPAVVRPYRARLERIAWCESRQRWHINTGNGFTGGLQFTLRSWRWVGGRRWPYQNSKLEQMYRAVLLKRRQGWAAWPICGRR